MRARVDIYNQYPGAFEGGEDGTDAADDNDNDDVVAGWGVGFSMAGCDGW